MATNTIFICTIDCRDYLSVRMVDGNEVSISYFTDSTTINEIILNKDDVERLILELNLIYKKL
jgi:hypothetical protein